MTRGLPNESVYERVVIIGERVLDHSECMDYMEKAITFIYVQDHLYFHVDFTFSIPGKF